MMNAMDDALPYRYGLLDPGSSVAAAIHNRALVAGNTLGIEVTAASLIMVCSNGNIDPQHGPSRERRAAIEAAVDWPLPKVGTSLVTIRPDLDALGAMAVLTWRALGRPPDETTLNRVSIIAQADKFDHGQWPGPRLPTELSQANPGPGANPNEVAALGCACRDRALGTEDRVRRVMTWLASGEVPATYSDALAAENRRILSSLAQGTSSMTVPRWGKAAIVVSPILGALRIGYCLAPVVIAVNEDYRHDNGPTCRKMTIAQFTEGYVDFAALRCNLNWMEPGWGGSMTILGSRQGRSCGLSLEDAFAVVQRHRLQ
jgi:hypothetical protein